MDSAIRLTAPAVLLFTITLYPPTLESGLLFLVAPTVTFAAMAWLGKRFYLHRYGVMTEGRVIKSLVKTSRVKTGEFSVSERTYTHYLTIQFTGPDGVRRTIKGTHYSSEDDEGSEDIPRVGGTVPVFYSKSNPDNAIYFDRHWHYIVPAHRCFSGFSSLR